MDDLTLPIIALSVSVISLAYSIYRTYKPF
jgi:hypothetical protein